MATNFSNVAIIIYLLDKSLFRIGNHKYYKLYGSHGCITLQKEHITLNDDKKILTLNLLVKKELLMKIHF